MNQLVHAVARVRAMEDSLLTPEKVERIISAPSFESAYAVLDDLGYSQEASYFRESQDIDGALEMGIYSSMQVFKSFGVGEYLHILLVLVDIQNTITLCSSYKKQEDEDAAEQSLIPYGSYSISRLKKAVFGDVVISEISPIIQEACTMESSQERADYISASFLKKARIIAGRNSFCHKFLDRIEAIESMKKDMLSFSLQELKEKYPLYSSEISSIVEDEVPQKITALEMIAEEEMISFLQKESLGKIDGLEPLFSFFYRRERNARVIRSLLIAKKIGMSPEVIRKEFRQFVF